MPDAPQNGHGDAGGYAFVESGRVGIRPGDRAVFETPFMIGGALDCRLGFWYVIYEL